MDLMCQDIHFGIGEKKILKGVSLKLEGNQFHTILGPNGSGKTSLLKLLYRQEKPNQGLISLNGKPIEQMSVKETAKRMAVITQFNQLQFDCTVEEIVMLGRTPHLSFLQKEKEKDFALVEDALVKVDMFEKRNRLYSSLSGGEKQRVLLARALAQEPSLLLLDEPTNHLDMRTKDVLKEAIQAFDGTVILVSHDRDFLDGLVTKVYEFGNGLVREHLGGIYDFLRKKELQDLKSLEAALTQSTANADTPRQAQGKLSYEEQKEQARQLRKVEKEVKEREEAISRIEATLQDLEQQMSTPEGAADAALITQYAAHQKELEQTMADWEAAASRLEEIQSK